MSIIHLRPADAITVTDWDDVRVLIASLDAFARDAEAQARAEGAWLDDDVPHTHIDVLQNWAARARTICSQAERALEDHVSQPAPPRRPDTTLPAPQ